MISKNLEEKTKILEQRKALIKRRKRFPLWTIEEIKFMYGIPDNKKHFFDKFKIKNVSPKGLKLNIKVKEVKVDARSNKSNSTDESNTATDSPNKQ